MRRKEKESNRSNRREATLRNKCKRKKGRVEDEREKVNKEGKIR